MTHFIAGAVAFLLCALPSSAAEPTKPQTPKNDAVDVPYSGTVTEVTKDSITVEWPGEKPKKFPVSETLAAGRIPKEPRLIPNRRQPYQVHDCFRYRLTDVQVGDIVVIAYAHLGNSDICDHICIRKRPGGRIPPLPEGAGPLKQLPPGAQGQGLDYLLIPYHEQMNAYWDLEDRGIPYPEKFGPRRRFPVAPEPRAVKLGPSIVP
jgi:hypothetical protein